MPNFCEAMVGSRQDRMCCGAPAGRCHNCWRTMCQVHSKILESNLFCLDCAQLKSAETASSPNLNNEEAYLFSEDFEIDVVTLLEIDKM